MGVPGLFQALPAADSVAAAPPEALPVELKAAIPTDVVLRIAET
jgi:hypothetical protein